VEQLARVKGLLENLRTKVPTEEKQQIDIFLRSLQPTKHFIRAPISSITQDQAWDAYTELSTLTVRLQQLIEDTKWD
jgi:hypothetical protein